MAFFLVAESVRKYGSNPLSLSEVYLRVREPIDVPTSQVYVFTRVVDAEPNLTSCVPRIVDGALFGFHEPIENTPRTST